MDRVARFLSNPRAALGRGAAALTYRYRALSFRPYVITKHLAGHDFLCLIGHVDARYMYDRVHAWPELAFVADHLLSPGDLVADCGANHGLTGMLFAKCVGTSGKVVGFEPNPSNASIARRNACMNGIHNFEVREVAVGVTKGTVRFVPDMNGYVTTAAIGAVRVPQVTLDDEFPERAPDLVKIDVEGHELEVLRGACRVFSRLPKFDIEVHVAAFSDARAALRDLARLLPLSEYVVYLQRIIDGPIVETTLDDRALEDLARMTNVHLFGKPKRGT
jgi:FkbM family methyltransferase